jgi:hypothetical protein
MNFIAQTAMNTMTICDIVCKHYGVDRDTLIAHNNTRKAPWPMIRFVIIYLEHKYKSTSNTFQVMEKHRTNLYHAIKSVQNEMLYSSFRDFLENIERTIVNNNYHPSKDVTRFPRNASGIYVVINKDRYGQVTDEHICSTKEEMKRKRIFSLTRRSQIKANGEAFFNTFRPCSVVRKYNTRKQYNADNPAWQTIYY